MSKILTYVASNTYDEVELKMYPDEEPVLRDADEIERLIVQGHLVQYRKGTMSMDLDLEKFNSLVKPLYMDETPVNNVSNFDDILNSIAPSIEPGDVVESNTTAIPEDFPTEVSKGIDKIITPEPAPEEKKSEQPVIVGGAPVDKNKKKKEEGGNN